MANVVPLDPRQIALDLYGLLRDLDPIRWRDELEASIRERLATIAQALGALLEAGWELSARVRAHLSEIRDILVRYAPGEEDTRGEARRRWMELRARCQPAYEALAQALRADGARYVPSLRTTNHTRSLYHVANAVGVILLVELVLQSPTARIGTALAAAGLGWGMELSRRWSPKINELLMQLFGKVAHPHEAHHVNSATWYVTAVLLLSVSVSVEVGVGALAVLGLGDPIAALVGRRWGRTPLLYNRTLEGSLAFVGAGG
ncbi:MAG TPA: hypothetical protein ENK18_03885, partial [Deltaproteobacteria bacterium]|nr:hypothetical protein [Deltaproteobacteria bacterium]